MNTRSPSRSQSQRNQQPPRSNHPGNQVTGIYGIRIKGQWYIGQSTSIFDRADQHAGDLQSRRHANYKLQALFDQHGARSFDLYLIQECDRKDLNRFEAYWISKLGELNIERPKPPHILFPPRNQRRHLVNFGDLVKESGKGKSKGKERSPSSGILWQLLWLILAMLVSSHISVRFGFGWKPGLWVGGIGWAVLTLPPRNRRQQ